MPGMDVDPFPSLQSLARTMLLSLEQTIQDFQELSLVSRKNRPQSRASTLALPQSRDVTL
jgi:hypothetical protein